MPISALPTPPSRQDPTNFNDRADAFLGALPLFQSEANTLQTDVNAKQVAAEASATNAAASELAAANTSGATIWVSGTTYAVGNTRFSPVNFLTYRRKTAGAGTTDPSADATNWQLLTGLGDVTLSGAQTISGVKTFSNGIVGDVTGNADTVTNGVYTTGTQTISGVKTFSSGLNGNLIGNVTGNLTGNVTGNTDTATKLSTASGSAPSYSARAWVNFNGTGTVAIRASANVSSITDNGTGDYTVNFTTAMPDANYAVIRAATDSGGTEGWPLSATSQATSSVRVVARPPGYSPNNMLEVSVAIFR